MQKVADAALPQPDIFFSMFCLFTGSDSFQWPAPVTDDQVH